MGVLQESGLCICPTKIIVWEGRVLMQGHTEWQLGTTEGVLLASTATALNTPSRPNHVPSS